MPILYSVVSRETTVLAKHASCAGNFAEVTEQVLKTITDDGKLTYSHGKYRFHYVSENRIIYLCVTDDEFERSKAFGFLNDIRARFLNTYGSRIYNALPYAMNSDFSVVLAAEMKAFSEERELNKVAQVRSQVDDLKTIMITNIDALANRGERLELLVDRSENLQAGAVSFRTTSKTLARHMCVKNVKIMLIAFGVFSVLLFIIVTASCGGFSYPKC